MKHYKQKIEDRIKWTVNKLSDNDDLVEHGSTERADNGETF